MRWLYSPMLDNAIIDVYSSRIPWLCMFFAYVIRVHSVIFGSARQVESSLSTSTGGTVEVEVVRLCTQLRSGSLYTLNATC